MEPFIAGLINNPKVPEWLRFVIVTIACGLVIFLGVMLIIKSPMIAGKFFGGALISLFFAAVVYLFIKISKSKNDTPDK